MHAWVQDVPITEDIYQQILTRLGPEPLDGLIVHLVLRGESDTLRYIDVWESPEACDRAFEERIHPAVSSVLKEIGFRSPIGEPPRQAVQVLDVLLGAGSPQ